MRAFFTKETLPTFSLNIFQCREITTAHENCSMFYSFLVFWQLWVFFFMQHKSFFLYFQSLDLLMSSSSPIFSSLTALQTFEDSDCVPGRSSSLALTSLGCQCPLMTQPRVFALRLPFCLFLCLCPCWHLTSRHDLNSTKLNRAFTILCLGHFMQLKPTLIFYEAFHLFSMHCSHGLP